MANWSEHYRPTQKGVWEGRVDDTEDVDFFRWHQIIEFLDLSQPQVPPILKEKTGFCFLGFCCDEGVKRNLGRPGASRGPLSIRKELSNLPCSFERKIKLFDAGDIHCDDGDLEKSQEELAAAVKKIFHLGLFPIVLGGGHELAFGHYRGLREALGENSEERNSVLGIISLDAHLDLRPYDKGANSGTMFLQIADLCLAEPRSFSCFYLGIQRSANTVGLFKRADRLRAQYVLAKDVQETNLPAILGQLNEFLRNSDRFYLTLCSDVFSAAFAPGVSSPQPFGLHPEMVLLLIKYILRSGKVMSFDIAEVSPRFDQDNRTAKLAAIVIFAVVNTISESAGPKD